MTADGGGLVGAVLRPVEGGARIAQYMIAIADKAPGLRILERSVAGAPGLIAQRAGVTVTVAAFGASGGRATRIWVVRNPEKLRLWTPGEPGGVRTPEPIADTEAGPRTQRRGPTAAGTT